MMKQMESLGLEFDLGAIGLGINNNTTSYLNNKIVLDEIKEVTDESIAVDELEQLFLKSYEEESSHDDILFEGWKKSFDEEEDNYPSDDEGDFFEPCVAELIPTDEANLCQPGISLYIIFY